METVAVKAYEQIANRISTANKKSVDYYLNVFLGDVVEIFSLRELGFTSVQNLQDQKIEEFDINRAKLKAFFNKPVLHESELKELEKQFKLQRHVASRFVDRIPEANVQEILKYHDWIRKEQKNFGKLTTDKYFVPLTAPYEVTAPATMFRKALDWNEMNAAERQKWIEDDPIVTKRIYQFDPNPMLVKDKNHPTDWHVVVTAWGLEALFVSGNIPTAN